MLFRDAISGVLPVVRPASGGVALVVLGGCDGPMSTLAPAGTGAAILAGLWWWLFSGAVVIWLAVLALAGYAVYVREGRHELLRVRLLIIGGGAALPTVVLLALLLWSLPLIPALRPSAPTDGMRLAVEGRQWWWRVVYHTPDGRSIPVANEVRLPVDETVAFTLTSPDVIHSFWIPSLGGKMDMIPGRTNPLVLEPRETGIFRGACAEYCGTSHALMHFAVVVMEKEAFADWLADQAEPAEPPATEEAIRGRDLFLAYGCGACHTIRGTPADGRIAPDLTHVGSRLTLGAGVLPNEPQAFMRWIADTHTVKPAAKMPPFGMLPEDDLRAIALYLDGLT